MKTALDETEPICMQQERCHTVVPIPLKPIGFWHYSPAASWHLNACSRLCHPSPIHLLLASIQRLWGSHLATNVQWMLPVDCSPEPRDSVLTNVCPPMNVRLCSLLLQCRGCVWGVTHCQWLFHCKAFETIPQCPKSQVDYVTWLLISEQCFKKFSFDLYFRGSFSEGCEHKPPID